MEGLREVPARVLTLRSTNGGSLGEEGHCNGENEHEEGIHRGALIKILKDER